MSGLWRTTRRMVGRAINVRKSKLGKNKDPHYGNVADEMLAQGGKKQYSRYLRDQGATTRGNRYDRLPPTSSSGQLLGGG